VIRVNYIKRNDEIIALTKIPFDETKPYLELTEKQYDTFITERAIKNLKNALENHPQLSEYYQPKIDALQEKLDSLVEL